MHSADDGLPVLRKRWALWDDVNLGLPLNDGLNLGFVKIARDNGLYVCEQTKKNRYGRAVL